MEYCSSVWGNCDSGKLDEIFKIQKRCGRHILDVSPAEMRSRELFTKLAWHPIDKLCLARRLFLLLKIQAKLAPQYLIDKLDSFKFSHRYSTRKSSLYRLPVPRTNSLKRTFFYTSITLLNTLNIDPNLSPKNASKAYLTSTMKSFNDDNFQVSRIY